MVIFPREAAQMWAYSSSYSPCSNSFFAVISRSQRGWWISDAPRRLTRSERSSFVSIGARHTHGELTQPNQRRGSPAVQNARFRPAPPVRTVRAATNEAAPTTPRQRRPPRAGGRQYEVVFRAAALRPFRPPWVISRPVTRASSHFRTPLRSRRSSGKRSPLRP